MYRKDARSVAFGRLRSMRRIPGLRRFAFICEEVQVQMEGEVSLGVSEASEAD
jgi:hypothetical protein